MFRSAAPSPQNAASIRDTDHMPFADTAAAYNSIANGPYSAAPEGKADFAVLTDVWFLRHRSRCPERQGRARQACRRDVQPCCLAPDSFLSSGYRPGLDPLPLFLLRAPVLEQSPYAARPGLDTMQCTVADRHLQVLPPLPMHPLSVPSSWPDTWISFDGASSSPGWPWGSPWPPRSSVRPS